MTDNKDLKVQTEQKQKTPEELYKDALKKFHQASNRHVLVAEAHLKPADKIKIFKYSENERKFSNKLTGIMQNNLKQLKRTKRYRNLQSLYKKYTESGDKENKKLIASQMQEMQKQYGATWDFCRTKGAKLAKEFKLDSIFALTIAEDVWSGVEKVLYGNGKKLHFKKYGDSPTIRAKQPNRGIVVKVGDNTLVFKFRGIEIPIKIEDRFQNDEVNAILHYLAHSDKIDEKAVKAYEKDKTLTDTYRPCYASLVCETIRGRLRIYVHLTVEGSAKPKYKKDGTKRHQLGKGKSGTDIGTQSYAYTTKKEVGLNNLAERGRSVKENEDKEAELLRKMESSRRANNPQYYNEDGTIKKGKKKWHNSKRYKKYAAQLKDLKRVNAINRHLAIREDVWHLRSLADIVITEPKSASEWKQRVEETVVDNNGNETVQHKKNHGHAIQNRCPGYFQQCLQEIFTSTGGHYIEVPSNYRASQYDHTADDYIKKELSDRVYELADGTLVQRDWYSSFTLYCADLSDLENITIDKKKCNKEFAELYTKEQSMIQEIIDKKLVIMNSGIEIH